VPKRKSTGRSSAGPDQSYKRIPALAAYIDRVGAEQLNFRRFMIRDYRGNYYVERTLIRLLADGTISCSRREHDPTDAEREAIKAAVIKEKWPTAAPTSVASVSLLRKLTDGDLHVFLDRERKRVLFVQERRTLRGGAKRYLPWTFFSDGKWRQMEPDGKLPFWKPETTSSKIMIHEGAKAAAFVDGLVNDPARKKELAKHPWGEELREYSHWGMIGGALAPQRTDYDELRAERPTEVIYVCDNDFPGNSALEEVSRCYGGGLKGIRFDTKWPPSWDMADPMPKTDKFWAGDRYIGPRLRELTVPATHATEQVPQDGKGRPTYTIRRVFKEEWLHAVTPEVFIHRDWPNRILTTAEFNNHVAPFSNVDDTARLVKRDATSKSAVLKYDPANQPGIYGSGDSGRYVNTFLPTAIVAEDGDPKPFLDFMAGLCPVETDRLELLRWCATLIARPDIKMLYGVLLISETQGVGKGTLGEKILAPLVGHHNVSYPTEREICDSGYNYWLSHKRLAVVHEIYAGHSAKAYNELKSIITDNRITVMKKFMANYEVDNWIHVFACSNSMRAIQLSSDDRRWFVPRINEDKRPATYWAEFNRWLVAEGGLGIIMKWAQDFVEENDPVIPGADAPWTGIKKEIIEEGYSPGMSFVSGFLDRLIEEAGNDAFVVRNTKPKAANGEWRPEGWAIFDAALVRLITHQIYQGRRSDHLERPLTLRKIAKSKGLFVHPEKTSASGSTHAKLIVSSRAMLDVPIKRLLETTRPIDPIELSQQWFPL
jgi:hypothetical protein